MSQSTTVTRKIGRNRGAARLWLEGPCLAAHGWNKGTRFTARFAPGSLRYVIEKDATGPVRQVAGTAQRPIIDTNTDKLTATLGVKIGGTVTVVITAEAITVTPAAP